MKRKRFTEEQIIGVRRLTLLAPEIVDAILAGRQPEGLTMARAMQPFPVEWERQSCSIRQLSE